MSSGMSMLDTSLSAFGPVSRIGSSEVTSLLSRVNLILCASGLMVIISVVVPVMAASEFDKEGEEEEEEEEEEEDRLRLSVEVSTLPAIVVP